MIFEKVTTVRLRQEDLEVLDRIGERMGIENRATVIRMIIAEYANYHGYRKV